MPLLDHFHPPLKGERNWEGFHGAWTFTIVETLNKFLPARYFAEGQSHVGPHIEVDVANFERENEPPPSASANGGGVAVKPWTAPAATLTMPATFPDEFEVRVIDTRSGPTLVAAIELISPGNKDRAETRRQFAGKCASYLAAGIGLVIVDIVTDRTANLHDELIELLQHGDAYRFPVPADLYSVAYRPRKLKDAAGQVEIWTFPLAFGEPLPVVPLALRGGLTLRLDLDATYTLTRERNRL
jgi:hypothetical protein